MVKFVILLPALLLVMPLYSQGIQSFDADYLGSEIHLKWEVANNTKGEYLILRSEDNQTFFSIGSIHANEAHQSYLFVDKLTVNEAIDSLFYRLMWIDTQGSRQAVAEAKLELTARPFEVYPNPSVDHIYIRKSKTHMHEMAFRLIDLQGRSLMDSSIDLSINEEIRIDVSHFVRGTYFCEVIYKEGKYSEMIRIGN
ncbi:MAG: T9SS type A sorting domain-containing protein [Bacteroidia bacterium]|nr:T9SS type A sorting domain-containing protein [Bacteroidia bacterium]